MVKNLTIFLLFFPFLNTAIAAVNLGKTCTVVISVTATMCLDVECSQNSTSSKSADLREKPNASLTDSSLAKTQKLSSYALEDKRNVENAELNIIFKEAEEWADAKLTQCKTGNSEGCLTEISSLLSQLRKEGMEIYPNEIAVDGIECLGTGDISFRASCAFGAGIMKVLRYEFAKSLIGKTELTKISDWSALDEIFLENHLAGEIFSSNNPEQNEWGELGSCGAGPSGIGSICLWDASCWKRMYSLQEIACGAFPWSSPEGRYCVSSYKTSSNGYSDFQFSREACLK